MDIEKLQRLAGSVRTGGKGTVRRCVPRTAAETRGDAERLGKTRFRAPGVEVRSGESGAGRGSSVPASSGSAGWAIWGV